MGQSDLHNIPPHRASQNVIPGCLQVLAVELHVVPYSQPPVLHTVGVGALGHLSTILEWFHEAPTMTRNILFIHFEVKIT